MFSIKLGKIKKENGYKCKIYSMILNKNCKKKQQTNIVGKINEMWARLYIFLF